METVERADQPDVDSGASTAMLLRRSGRALPIRPASTRRPRCRSTRSRRSPSRTARSATSGAAGSDRSSSPGASSRSTGSTRQWFEHCRYFENGPLKSLCAELRLAPTDAGCEGRYRITAEPAGLLGSVMLRSGLFFRRAGAPSPGSPTMPATTRPGCARRRSTCRRRACRKGRRSAPPTWSRRIEATPYGHGLAGRLAELVLSAQEVDLWHIRPLRLARAWGRPEREVIELCLQAVRAGLLDLQWSLLCPRCRIAKANVGGLDQLPRGAHCGTCNIDYEREFSRNVEASFKPAAAIRPIAGGAYCLFGPMSTPHIKVHVTVGAGASRMLDAALPHGSYRLRTLEPGRRARSGVARRRLPVGDRRAGRARARRARRRRPASSLCCNRAARPLTFVIEEREWVRDALTRGPAERDAGVSRPVLRPGAAAGRRGRASATSR